MGQAFDRQGNVLGEAFGKTRREVLEKLETAHADAAEIRIRSLLAVRNSQLTIAQIAEVCHEANRAYCQSIGDASQPTWEHAPDWQRQSAIKGVGFHLDAHSRGVKPAPSASHDSWLEEKRSAGWTYGPEKNPELKQHPCFVPYEQLPLEQRLKDALFGNIVEALR